MLAAIEPETPQTCRLTAWRTLSKVERRRREKNWTPVLGGGELRFIYTFDPAVLMDRDGHETATRIPEFAADHFRGGSQAIPFDNGYLCVIHEMVLIENKRTYIHRFVQTDRDGVLISCSRPFYFLAKGIEFAAGLARRPQGNRLLVSFGFEDKEAWLAEFDEEDVRRTLRPALP